MNTSLLNAIHNTSCSFIQDTYIQMYVHIYLPSKTSAPTNVIKDPVTYCATVYGTGPTKHIVNPKHVKTCDAKRICLQRFMEVSINA